MASMCGIAGFLGDALPDQARRAAALRSLQRRGPDHAGQFVFTLGAQHGCLLHTRLSIVDLDSRSNQPFVRHGLTLVFNGEIYNHIEVRQALKAAGVGFRTTSDTEVLLEAWRAWGPAALDRLEGMWAFALYDNRSKTLTLSRDRFAEKPLYYWQDNSNLYFASEVKAIERLRGQHLTPNLRQMQRFLVNGYRALYKQDATFFEGLKEIPAGCCMTITAGAAAKITRYWQPRYDPQPISRADAVNGIRERLIEAIRIRLRADVPLAFCLSGGVDSGALTSIAAKVCGHDVTTFSIRDQDARYDELANIQATVTDLGCESHILPVPFDDTRARLETLIRYHDAPLYAISHLLYASLMEQVAASGFRVCVAGSGADELFTGYYDHFNLHLYEMRNHLEFEHALAAWERGPGQFVRNPHLRNPRLYIENPGFREHNYLNRELFATLLTEPFDEPFAEQHYCDDLLRNRMLNELFHESIPVMMHEEDHNAMFHSIENRSPFLDRNLFEFVYSIPSEHLIDNGYGKSLLRDATEGLLNDQVRLDQHKRGFNGSFNSLFDLDDPDTRAWLTEPSPIFDLVRCDKMTELLDPNELPNSISKCLFTFVNLKIFLEQRQTPLDLSADALEPASAIGV
jgi:asparagine synthase (glutamine-hydrolysing)